MKKILFLILLSSPLLYSATPHNGTIYVWGYMDIMENILQAIKGMVMEMGGLTKIAMGIALLVFSIRKAIDSRINPVMEFAKISLLFIVVSWAFLQAPNDDKHRFVIEDEATGELRAVSQIPIGIGKTLSIITTVEREMAHLMEKFFSTPNSLQFSTSGFGYSLRTHFTNAKMTSVDGFYLQTFNDYFKNCVQVDLITRQKPISDISYSYDLAESLFDSKRTLFTFIYEKARPNGEIKECREVAQYLKGNLPNQVVQVESLAARMNGETIDHYRNNANGVVQLFFNSNKSSREYLQQMMLINMTNEAIVNSAKAVGLDPAAKAWGSAIANYNLTQQMQIQGRLAQTYLPKAKAYFTVIIVAITFLIALLCILFGDYMYIKTLFILHIWLMFWTPILIVINYFNDLNLEDTFKHIQTVGYQGLSYMSNQIILQKMVENSNFINYMVMATPVLAYGIVKGSEHAFVSLATMLSQSMQGASRAGANDSQKQAMDTKPSLRQGNDIYADNMGQTQVSTATLTNSGINFSTLHSAGGTRTLRDDNANNTATVDSSGKILSANIDGVNANTMQQETQTRQDSLANSISDTYKNGTNRAITSNYLRNNGAAVEDSKNIEKAESKALQDTIREVFSDSSKYSEFDKKQLEAAGGIDLKIIRAGGSVATGTTEMQEYVKTMSKEGQAAFNKSFSEKISHTIKNDETVAASFANSLSTMQGNEYANAKQAAQAYTEAKTHSQSFSVNNMPSIVENYMQAKGLQGDSGIMQAERDIQQAAASGNMSSVMSYAGMDSSAPSSSGLSAPSQGGYYNPQEASIDNAHNNDKVNNQRKLNELQGSGSNSIKSSFEKGNEKELSHYNATGELTRDAVEGNTGNMTHEQSKKQFDAANRKSLEQLDEIRRSID
ncbi:conjugal transfer protein TraG N-terminal domain-containing protein [Campylobacter upsaliensis]|uniref:conjugal transfer protein TraG N-terminal domain-containing protein n=1 Tax=Campylobacter upsaliensis TaxID=28080 RepID=UPI002149E54C|nr:conjugal transfer protein TraG N-terminal domain-containing protein [Campylobacter upsaliensis]MCR2114035.1 conjugal transfer protein TraG N-terminal domain-containing protein [Campylobacter upsaliensis]